MGFGWPRNTQAAPDVCFVMATRPPMVILWFRPRHRRVGLTLGSGRAFMHGVAPHGCGQVAGPLLGGGAGGRSPGFLFFGNHPCAAPPVFWPACFGHVAIPAHKKPSLAEE